MFNFLENLMKIHFLRNLNQERILVGNFNFKLQHICIMTFTQAGVMGILLFISVLIVILEVCWYVKCFVSQLDDLLPSAIKSNNN